MKNILGTLLLAGFSLASVAQTPALNLMPEGSRDTYVGLGLAARPIYEGARERRLELSPVLQVEWSNGVFVSGTSLGLHLSARPALEYGPLLALQAARTESGTGLFVDSPSAGLGISGTPSAVPQPQPGVNRLKGMDQIDARLEWGGFVNVYLASQLRLTQSLLAGGGNAAQGLRWQLDLQKVLPLAQHHTLALSGGWVWANDAYTQAFFGVSSDEAKRSLNPAYAPSAGVKDLHAELRWNWALAPDWLLSSALRVTQLRGDAAASPLVEQTNQSNLSVLLAYRF